jgi:putative sigma-54 modulation protein
MRTEIIYRNYKEENSDTRQKLAEILDKKLKKLGKYFDAEAIAKVKLSTIGNGKFVMEITIVVDNKQIVRTETMSDNMFGNIDILIPKLEKQLSKYNTRLVTKMRKAAQTSVSDEKTDTEPAETYGKIVKVKNFAISILTVQQAIAELELLDHNFYVFVNAEDNLVSVVYRRNDGDYGLISPKY